MIMATLSPLSAQSIPDLAQDVVVCNPIPVASTSALPFAGAVAFGRALLQREPSPQLPAVPFVPRQCRANERLAVSLPKNMWKPDSHASKCDTFECKTSFSLFERKHHCRKCGGVFCGQCTANKTNLLDTTDAPYIHPPAHLINDILASPTAPITSCRVCIDCYALIHGKPTPAAALVRVRRPTPPPPQPVVWRRTSDQSGSYNSSPSTPPDGYSPRPPRRRPSLSSLMSRRSPRTPGFLLPCEIPVPAMYTDEDPALGPLNAYPLRNPSAICKRLGGGVWKPKPMPPKYEACPEEDDPEYAQEIYKINPLIVDGSIQTRVPQEPEPLKPNKPLNWSTF